MPTASTYGYHWRKACAAAGVVTPDGKPKYTPHSLIHFFDSAALANGVPIHEVSRWPGHRNIKTTLDTYGHLVPEAWDRCRDHLAQGRRQRIQGVQGKVLLGRFGLRVSRGFGSGRHVHEHRVGVEPRVDPRGAGARLGCTGAWLQDRQGGARRMDGPTPSAR
ncbi:hypothetical protein [Streptomyces sp. NPDC002133]|uniref:hypothetical protein n=1 Tax=Streptomyces sp. NPDC002133 TaxID=3154409 RepID=UPI00331E242D